MVIAILCTSKDISIRLVELINETNNGAIFYSAFSHAEAINCLGKHKTDIVLLDFDFAGNDTVQLLKWIKKNSVETVVMVLYSLAGELRLKQFRNCGADYLFDRYNDFEKIAPVIKTICKAVSF